MRLDQWIKGRFPHLSSAVYFGIFKKKQVKLNGSRPEPKDRLREGDELVFFCKEINEEKIQTNLGSEIRIDADKGLLVLNKPAGLAVHPGAGQVLGQSLIEILEQEALAQGSVVPKLVHRLDQGTSGVILLATDDEVLANALKALKKHDLRKRYYALVAGDPGAEGQVDEALNFQGGRDGKMKVGSGKESLTLWWKVRSFEHPDLGVFSLLDVEPWTGRMHQIRTHMTHLGHPLIGDPRYGDFALNARVKKELGFKRMFLHARQLSWPGMGEWQAEMPAELQILLDKLC